MLKKRIITTMLWNGMTLVKGTNFVNERRAGSVITTLQIYNSRDVDEIVFLDISKTQNKLKKIDKQFYMEIASFCSVPLSIGGGIKNLNDIDDLLKSGADKIVINSENYRDPKLIELAAKKFGSQTIVASIDYKKINNIDTCFSNNGTINEKVSPMDWATECFNRGAGEIILTSIDHCGLMKGYDINTIKKISNKIDLPIICSGGAGNYQHMLEALNVGASAVSGASIFHFTENTPHQAKMFLKKNNIDIRKNLN